jgi:UDP-N-acetylglucosamine 2-epimerase (non-hydrolysing)
MTSAWHLMEHPPRADVTPARQLTIAIVVGTRPEAIKLAPVARELERRSWARLVMVGAGQHRALLDQATIDLGLRFDESLVVDRVSHSLAELTSALLVAIDAALDRIRPDLVLLQGDTASALAGAMAAFYRGIPVGHIEAGLRSGNQMSPFPEEANRRMIAALAAWHFAPTPESREHLLREGIAPDAVTLTGNTIVDALRWTLEHSATKAPTDDGAPLLVVTMHRRESLGPSQARVLTALREFALKHPEVDIWLPLHPNPLARDAAITYLAALANVELAEPVGHAEFIAKLNQARLVLTDSGGVLEEAASLGIPALIAREMTERSEAIQAGVAELVGFDEETIVSKLESGMARPRARASSTVFGDGRAGQRIVDFIAAQFGLVDPID